MNGSGNGNVSSASALRCGWSREAAVDHKYPLFYLDKITYPLFLVLATTGNILNIMVFSKEIPALSKTVYLAAVACTDFGYMWAGFIPYLKYASREPGEFLLKFHEEIAGLCIYLQEAFSFASDWIIMAFTVDRFLAISSPLRHIKVKTPKRAAGIVGVIIGLSLLAAMDRLVDYYWFFTNDPGFGPLPIRPTYISEWRLVYSWTLVLAPVFTFLVILLLNLYLARTLLRIRNVRRSSLLGRNDSWSKNTARVDNRALRMLAACVLLYLLTQTPTVICNVCDIMDLICIRRRTRVVRAQTDPLKNIGLGLNYSLNFILYCAVNYSFRRSLRRILRQSVVNRAFLACVAKSIAILSQRTGGGSERTVGKSTCRRQDAFLLEPLRFVNTV